MLIEYQDYLGLSAAAFEWADSYDSKDWDRLRKCIAPELRVRGESVLFASHALREFLPNKITAD